MKTKLLAMLFALPFLSNAQFSQNFDAGTTTPTGWTVINGGDANTFVFGVGAPGSAFSAPNAAQINYSASAHDDYLVTPAITVTAGVNDRLTYFVKNQDPLYVEDYEVKLSTTTATAAAFTTTLTASAPAPSSWTQFVIDLTPYVGQTVYVGFHATSTDKFRLLFDNIVNDTAPAAGSVPCPVPVSPANGATGVSYSSVTLSWTASAGPVSHYEVYMGTTPNPTTKIGNFAGTTATVTSLNGQPLNGQYYWRVVAVNTPNVSTACTEYSFTTSANPFAGYCGPLTYTDGVEPITSVVFAGINNTSPSAVTSPAHEVFLDKVATVARGSSNVMTVKGNTGGNYTDRFVVFIDWNQNGVFNDAGEVYFNTLATAVAITNSTGTDTKEATGTIVVPATAMLGNTRMRIKKNYGTTVFYDNPCMSDATTGEGFGQAEDYTVTVTGTLGVNESNAKPALGVYPNPMKNILNISTADRKVTEVTFYSADGRQVKSVKDNISAINTDDLKAGVYVVKVKTSDAEQTFKVIKE